MYWTEWAAFGHQYKGEEKALKILAKGLNANPEPRCIVEEMKEAIEQGRYGVPVAPAVHPNVPEPKPPTAVPDQERDASVEARERFQREIAARQQQQQRATAPGFAAAAIVDAPHTAYRKEESKLLFSYCYSQPRSRGEGRAARLRVENSS